VPRVVTRLLEPEGQTTRQPRKRIGLAKSLRHIQEFGCCRAKYRIGQYPPQVGLRKRGEDPRLLKPVPETLCLDHSAQRVAHHGAKTGSFRMRLMLWRLLEPGMRGNEQRQGADLFRANSNLGSRGFKSGGDDLFANGISQGISPASSPSCQVAYGNVSASMVATARSLVASSLS